VTHLREKMLDELQRRNYSHRTAKMYIRIVRDFAEHFHRSPDKLGPEHIRQYQAHLFQAKKLAPASVAQYASALRFFFVKTLRRHFLAEHIPFPKQRRRLPTVLNPDEVGRLIDSASNLYHRTLLMTLYSTGMRRTELCRLKVSDIDSRRRMIRIQQGKGSRDREVPLSPKLLEERGALHQVSLPAHAAPQLCFASARGRCRPANHSGSTGALETGTYPRLPTPLSQTSTGDHQPARHAGSLQPRPGQAPQEA